MRKNFFSAATLLLLGLACLIGIGLSSGFFIWQLGPKIFYKKFIAKKHPQLDSNNLLALAGLEKAVREAEVMHNAPFESVIWKIYPEFVRLASSGKHVVDPEYSTKGYKEGIISLPLIESFKQTLKEAATKSISHDDFDPNYFTHPNLRPYESDLNASHKLYVLEEKQMKALEPILEELKGPIASCLGAPWSIINVLCWETFPDAKEVGPNDWHTDGLPLAINKVMVYLNGADENTGTTALKLSENNIYSHSGPPGSWLLFKISEIVHRGVKPMTGSRIALEIRVIPTIDFDLRPYAAGFNAYYPKLPWYQPVAKCPESFQPHNQL